MKGFLNRFFALVCCFSLTLGAFAYRAPKAKAVFTEPAVALGCALLTSVVVGTTANLVFTDTVKENIGYAIDGLVTEYLDTVGDVAATTSDNFFSIIASGPKLLTTGAILLSKEAGELIGRFIAWLQTEKGLEAGGESVNFGTPTAMIFYNGVLLPDINSVWTDKATYPYAIISAKNGEIKSLYISTVDFIVSSVFVCASGSGVYKNYYFTDGAWKAGGTTSVSSYFHLFRIADGSEQPFWSNFEICGDDTFYLAASDPVVELGDDAVLKPLETLQTIPQEIPDGQAMAIAGIDGITLDDQSVAANAIFDAVLAGTLSPTVTVEDVATDIPDTGTETDTSILSWTKKIWQAVTDIPAAIGEKLAAIPAAVADAISAVFAPDVALINEITSTFNAKFGFLETLHSVGTDLLNMDADTAPPVVYIHLEDAEGGVSWGGTEKALDMTWYQRYKADVDMILSGFLWVAFLWLLFKRAPDILAGAGLVERESSDIYMADAPDDLGGFFARHKRH